MKSLLLALVCLPRQDPPVAPGDAADFLRAVEGGFLDKPEARHAALTLLEQLPNTREWLGKPVARALSDDLERLLLEDLRAAAWADLA